MKALGYIVIECADDFEQVLGLLRGDVLPRDGVLNWCDGGTKRAVFATRKEARAAIVRTEHYRLAFDNTQLPASCYCRIEPVVAA